MTSSLQTEAGWKNSSFFFLAQGQAVKLMLMVPKLSYQ